MEVREPAVAGTFYASDARELARDVDAMLAAARARVHVADVKVLVVPHAGYVYSGDVAASAFASVAHAEEITRVVLIGPSHRVFLEGVAAPTARAMRTPLGDVMVDHVALDRAAVLRNDAPHAREHSLEVELPFVQRVFPNARVCPIVCGRASADDVARVIESLFGGRETLVVVSSDLSHYLPYDEGRAKDTRTAEKIVALDPNLDGEEACGWVGLRGMIVLAKKMDLACRLVDLRSSGDARRGARDEVVGYGAFAFSERSAS
jgi:hypothetical protein